ncbi:MAG TPA: glycosyltransferase [Candidatus Sumerlaeota bacterium]|nr:glycosyltransferase [Candidatus Sumerlaeota bacterium]
MTAPQATLPPQPAPRPPDARARIATRRVTLMHDLLLGMRGGEWVLDSLLKILPLAGIRTLFYRPRFIDTAINCRPIHPSPLSRLPGVRRYYRWLLPLLPPTVERLRVPERTELVLTLSHCVAHGIRAPRGVPQVNYYFSPMRYLYDQREAYRRHGGLGGRALGWLAPRLARWDFQAAARADHRWAISQFVARRIEDAYGLTARVIYPPVRTGFFVPPPPDRAAERIPEYLLVSAMVPYKRVDLAIRAANRLRLPLRVVGDGPLLRQMRRLAGPLVAVEGRVSQARLLELYQTRAALIFPSEEDFGLAPLEALACGMPVLGLRAGGLLETMREGRTGAFFDRPTVKSLCEAWEQFRPAAYDPLHLRAHALAFSEERFHEEIALAIDTVLNE